MKLTDLASAGHTSHLLRGDTRRPPDVDKAVACALERTQRQPALSLNHAVELDRELSRMGWSEPITYAMHGTASPCLNSDEDGAPWRTSAPGAFDCLYRAHRQSVESQGCALSMAFRRARGPEIPALNLLYANESVDIESLWIRFFNKYLSYYGSQNTVVLKPGTGSWFDRIHGASSSSTEKHTGGHWFEGVLNFVCEV